MINFLNDYSEGALPEIITALNAGNLEVHGGYGNDRDSAEAIKSLKKLIGNEQLAVQFLVGGTQTNLIVIAYLLRPYEAVIACRGGHIDEHETGAIEATGHKVLIAEAENGKLTVAAARKVLKAHHDEHAVKPKMLYISDSTEIGTVYTKKELTDLSHFAQEQNLYLFIDGARLASALCAKSNDLTLADIAELSDVFYLGGTKNGALFGEAVVSRHVELFRDFRYMCKQRGALLAKGWLLGLQFRELFKDGLYFKAAAKANAVAASLKAGLVRLNVPLLADGDSNQLFPILDSSLLPQLAQEFNFGIWEELDARHTVIRLVTSWASRKEDADYFIAYLAELLNNRRQ